MGVFAEYVQYHKRRENEKSKGDEFSNWIVIYYLLFWFCNDNDELVILHYIVTCAVT